MANWSLRNGMVALADGPLSIPEDQSKPNQWIQLKDPESLTFQATNGTRLRPFYLITTERYTTCCGFPTSGQGVAVQ
jgi:hypothetical protein